MGFLSALEALGSAAGGVATGIQEKQQKELQKAQIEKTKAETNQAVLTNIQNQIQAHPELKTNPNYNKIIHQYSKQFGLDVPYRPDGNIDWDVLSPQRDSLELIKEKYGLTPDKLRELSPEQQRFLAKTHPDIAEFFGDFSQQVPLLPHDQQLDKQMVLNYISQLGENKISFPEFQAGIKFVAGSDPSLQSQAEALINADPRVIAKATQTVQAKIDRYRQLGILDKERFTKMQAEIGSINSLEAYRTFMESHFQEVNQETMMRDYARIDSDNQHLEVERQNSQISRDRLALDVSRAQNKQPINGNLATLKADATATKNYLSTLQAQLNSAIRQGQQDVANDGDVSKPTQDHIDFLQKQIKEQTDLLANYTKYQQDISAGILRSHGINVATPPTVNHEAFPNQDAILSAVKTLPKAGRVQALKSSDAFKKMSAEQQSAAVKAIEALP